MSENIKYETFEQFWDDNYGKEFGYSDKCPSEPYYSIAEYSWEMGENHGYISAKTWHYVTDKLPPNPKESEDGKSILPLNYICAYDCGDGDYECDEFMYLGDGVWNGENKNYPIYAWMDCAVEVPLPRKENE